jgi:glucose/arabinose dehydrogenase
LRSTTILVFFGFLAMIFYAFLHVAYSSTNDGPNIKNKIQYFSCVEYITSVHCDLLHNNLSGFEYRATSTKIYELTNSHPFFVEGKYGQALEMLAKYREAVRFPSISNVTFNDFSVSFWVKGVQESEPLGQILSYVDNRNSAGWFFDMSGANGTSQSIRFVLTENSGKILPSPDVNIGPGTFHNIVGTFNGSTIRIYNDGQLVGETRYVGNYTGNAHLPLTIGSASYCASCNRWSGVIDDLRIYAKALSAKEIKEIFNNSVDSEIRGLIGHWTFDGQFNDISGNNHPGNQSTLLSSMAFAPDGRLFFTEKNTGQIRIMKDSQLVNEPFVKLDDVFVSWEQGLLGITLDPKFPQNHYVYVYYTSIDKKTNEVFNRVVRFIDQDNKGSEKTVLMDRIYAEKGYHSGGALAFGPDDKLYITVGDATEHPFAQDPSIVIGKVLRINRDGTIPQDNPFPNSPVYTIGNRNMFGIAFDKYGNGLLSENGDYYYDEINLIQKGGNYGFPIFQPANVAPEIANSTLSIKPLRSYWDTIAPTQMIYYDGDKIPLLKDKFTLGTYQGDIYALRLDTNSKEIVEEIKINFENYPFKPIVGIAESPQGDIYFGAYNIWKLNSSEISTKKQYLFPIEANTSFSVNIAGIQFSPSENKMVIDLRNRDDIPNPGLKSPSMIMLKIPKLLLKNITAVVDTSNNKQMQFVGATDSDYNTVKMDVPYTSQLQVAILGNSIAAPGELVLKG